jgi:signal peptidase I
LIEGISYLRRKPSRGEIIAFLSKGIPGIPQDQLLVKRVVGLPGEKVEISNDKLFINGSRVILPNESSRTSLDFPYTGFPNIITNITLSDTEYFVIGDNRTNSVDSRFYGPIKWSNIVGRVWFTYLHASEAW